MAWRQMRYRGGL